MLEGLEFVAHLRRCQGYTMALLMPYAIYTIGAQRTGELEFVALFSKPSKEEPIAWSVNKKKSLFNIIYIYNI